jgi:hypothetical protein
MKQFGMYSGLSYIHRLNVAFDRGGAAGLYSSYELFRRSLLSLV